MIKKFRSWNKDLKKFIYFENGLYYKCCNESKLRSYVRSGFFDWDNAEQWTGLTDTNGIGIYENDIIKFLRKQGYRTHNKGDVDVVRFVSNRLHCGFIFEGYNNALTAKKAEELEIICNIHEYSELLKGEN